MVGSTNNTNGTQTQLGQAFELVFQPKQPKPPNLGYKLVERALGQELSLNKTGVSNCVVAFLRAIVKVPLHLLGI